MTELVYRNNAGFGNLLIQLTSLQEECKQLHDHVFAYELSNCLTINGFTRVSYEGKQPECPIYINEHSIDHVHPKIRDIIKPTPFMEDLISKHIHLLDNVSCGVSIRRGSYCEDSRQYKDERANCPSYYHCSDTGLDKFKDVIRNVQGKVFLTSDSQSTIKSLVNEFGDKIITIDTHFTMGTSQDRDGEKKYTDYHNIYLLFFLMSKCPRLFITGGNKDLVGFSTYAYMAAIYGNKPFNMIFNH